MMFRFSQTSLPETGHQAWIFLLDSTGMAIDPDTGQVPCVSPDQAEAIATGGLYPFGFLDGIPCCCGTLNRDNLDHGKVGRKISRLNIRKYYHRASEDFRLAIATARHLVDLHANVRFCGRCGTPTSTMEKEPGRTCPACGLTVYPRISPAVIMSVTRGEEILLARGVRFPNKKMFSVLAGFVSPGETLEECVAREVYEETRIRVKHIRYVASQPWPFPDSLMIGFRAEYDSGEIVIEPEEIEEAAWFTADDLPLIPDAYTLAGRLIRDFTGDLV